MAKYIFIRNYVWTSPAPECSKSNPPCSYMPMSPISFNKGDIIEGTVGGQPEIDLGYVQANTPNGRVRIGIGRNSPIQLYKKDVPIEKDGSGQYIVTDDPITYKIKKYATPKNIIIGLIGIAAIYGVFKFVNLSSKSV